MSNVVKVNEVGYDLVECARGILAKGNSVAVVLDHDEPIAYP